MDESVEVADKEIPEVATVRNVLDDDDIRKILATPRNIPRAIRKDIAEIVAHEIVLGESYDIKDVQKFSRKFGAFYLIFLALKNSKEWSALVALAQKSESIPVLALKAVLPKILDMMEEFSKYRTDLQKAIDKDMHELIEEFEKLVKKTMELWGRRVRREVPKAFQHPLDLAEFFKDVRSVSEEVLNIGHKEEDVEELILLLSQGPELLDKSAGALASKAEDLRRDENLDEKERMELAEQLSRSSTHFSERGEELQKRSESISALAGEGPGGELEGEVRSLNKSLQDIISDLEQLAEDTGGLFERTESLSFSSLQTEVQNFQDMDKAQEFMREMIRNVLSPKISDFISSIENQTDLLNTLSLLFPGRGWDYMITELHKTFLGDLSRYSKLLEKNEDIRKMLELMGRIELEYGSKRLAISPFGTSEIHSIKRSKDVQHVLPVELVKLQDDTLRTVFYANMMDGNLLTYEFKGESWVGGPPTEKRKGPVVALVDTSGSMSGSPEIVAKAVVFTIVKRMLKEKRDVKVILFSSTAQTDEIELTSMKKMAKEFLEFLSYSFGGGTDFNTALDAGLKSLKSKRFSSADLLFITDGLSVVSDESLIKGWKKFKNENDSRIFTLIVGNDTAAGLESLSDYVYILAEGENWHVDHSPVDLIKLISSG